MAIAQRGTPQAASRSSGGSLVINVPTGVVSGDVLICNVVVSGTTIPATPTGLTAIDSANAGPTYVTYQRVCDGTEGASFSWTLAGAGAGTIRAYSGVDNTTPINAHSAPNRTTSSLTVTATGVTTTVANCVLIFGAGLPATNSAFALASGYGNEAYSGTTSAGAASEDITQASAGASGNVSAAFTGTAGNNYGSLIAIAPASGSSPPANTVAPAVTGTATVGSTLTTTNGTWTDDGSPTFTYQWQRDVAGNGVYGNISSATSSTYVLASADDTCHVRCVVTDTDSHGATAANSNATAIVTFAVPVNSVAPVVSGNTVVGSVLSTTNGTWSNSPTSFGYQWTRDGVNISAATSSTYTSVSADATHAVGCTVTATNDGGTASGVASSNTISVVSAPSLSTVAGKTGTSGTAVMQKAKSGWTYITGKTGTSGTAVDQKGAGSFTKIKGH